MGEREGGDRDDDKEEKRPWTGTREECRSLTALIEIEPDLSEIVDERTARLKLWKYVQGATHALVEFLKWAAAIGGAVVVVKGALQGWLK